MLLLLLLFLLISNRHAAAEPKITELNDGTLISYDDSIDLDKRAPCEVVGILSVLRAFAGPATTFCSSFLGIGTSTIIMKKYPPHVSVRQRR